ncbi:hypothetical protein OGAPHI_000458 [Ogataea philodendri]|uniref:Protein YIP n=1 Tax=Ogataea philodendri TaxID=1378263 RepID=A0A9P8PGD9_9ASCO|nr:uncharacterized protein OGAPHI_000458 [Ogataea philodendri]KAH3671753.1 hypothetical protein OGAPHI_000458 [Ogataea philodendri]
MSYYQQPNLYNTPSQQNFYNGPLPTGSMQTGYSYTGNEQDRLPLSTGILAAFSSSGYPGEPPLLEELGINFGHIRSKTLAVLNLKSSSLSEDIIQDSDLAGPLIFCLLFGSLLFLSGKTHFGYIYGVALLGTISLHWLFKLMSNNSADDTLDFLRTASVIGYCLLPLVILSGLAVLIRLDNTWGYVLGFLAICWCTLSSSGFFVRVLNLSNARPLIAYPLAMFYSVFALMAIFVEKKE